MAPENEPWQGRWVVQKKLAEGGQGETYLATPRAGSALSVLKVLRKQIDQKARTRMVQEITNLEILNAQGAKVPVVVDHNRVAFREMDIPLYFVMDYIKGQTLDEVIKVHQKLPLEKSIALTRALCQTIATAHEHHIVHRDIKPGNVMVRSLENDDYVMIDFGLSFHHDEGLEVTDTGEHVGNKFLYLPESGAGSEDKRNNCSDVTRLVGVMYYCLRGHRIISSNFVSSTGSSVRWCNSIGGRCHA